MPNTTPTPTPKGISPTHAEAILKVVKAKKGQATLKDIVEGTGLSYRVVHNLTWRMEGSPKNGSFTKKDEAVIRRTNLDRKVTYGLKPKGMATPTMRGKYATKRED